jgi:hypothetical protein
MANYELNEQEISIISYALGLMYEFRINLMLVPLLKKWNMLQPNKR